MKMLATFLFVVAVSTSTAQAQLATCKAINDSLRRLACYDSLASKEPSAPLSSDSPKASSADGEWLMNVTTDPISDQKIVIAALMSDNKVGQYQREANLALRCMKGELAIIADWRSYLADNRKVTYRFDTSEPVSKSWGQSQAKDVLFVSGDIRAFAESLIGPKKLALQATPYESGPITAEFSLAGADKAVRKVLDACPAK